MHERHFSSECHKTVVTIFDQMTLKYCFKHCRCLCQNSQRLVSTNHSLNSVLGSGPTKLTWAFTHIDSPLVLTTSYKQCNEKHSPWFSFCNLSFSPKIMVWVHLLIPYAFYLTVEYSFVKTLMTIAIKYSRTFLFLSIYWATYCLLSSSAMWWTKSGKRQAANLDEPLWNVIGSWSV